MPAGEGASDPAIGRDSDSDLDHIHISGGLIFADGFKQYCDDIGYGKEHQYALDMDVQITGSAVVFLRNNKLADRDDNITVPFYDTETITDSRAYGYTVPYDWSGTAYAYISSAIPVLKVEVTPESKRLNLSASEWCYLSAEIFPFYATNPSVIYESDDPGVAVVDSSGLVTPVGIGTTTISAIAVDGGERDSCSVTVYAGVTGITVEPQEATLYLDAAQTGLDTVVLTPVFIPDNAENQTVTYRSDDTGIATVDGNGVVSAVSAGTTSITVESDDGGFTAVCDITVNQCATGVAVSPDTAVLVLGDNDATNDTVTLHAAVSPANAFDKSVRWTSDDPNVVTVDSITGLVTAQKAGSTKVTATTQDQGIEAEAVITVKQHATGVVLDTHEAALILGDADTTNDSILLQASIQPDDATETGLVWASSDPGIATVDANGLVEAVRYGTVEISVTTEKRTL